MNLNDIKELSNEIVTRTQEQSQKPISGTLCGRICLALHRLERLEDAIRFRDFNELPKDHAAKIQVKSKRGSINTYFGYMPPSDESQGGYYDDVFQVRDDNCYSAEQMNESDYTGWRYSLDYLGMEI